MCIIAFCLFGYCCAHQLSIASPPLFSNSPVIKMLGSSIIYLFCASVHSSRNDHMICQSIVISISLLIYLSSNDNAYDMTTLSRGDECLCMYQHCRHHFKPPFFPSQKESFHIKKKIFVLVSSSSSFFQIRCISSQANSSQRDAAMYNAYFSI